MSHPATKKTPTKAAVRAGWAKPAKPTKAAPAKPAKAKAPAAPPPAPAKPAATFAARCRDLFSQGLDNAAVWTILRPEFGMGERQSGAVAWHRGNEARKAAGWKPTPRRAAAYDATLAFFIANQPKAAAVIGAEKPSFSIQLLAKATGKPVETVQTDLRAALTKEG